MRGLFNLLLLLKTAESIQEQGCINAGYNTAHMVCSNKLGEIEIT